MRYPLLLFGILLAGSFGSRLGRRRDRARPRVYYFSDGDVISVEEETSGTSSEDPGDLPSSMIVVSMESRRRRPRFTFSSISSVSSSEEPISFMVSTEDGTSLDEMPMRHISSSSSSTTSTSTSSTSTRGNRSRRRRAGLMDPGDLGWPYGDAFTRAERRVFLTHMDIVDRIRGRQPDPSDRRRVEEARMFEGLVGKNRAGLEGDRLAPSRCRRRNTLAK